MVHIGLTEIRSQFHDAIRKVQFGGERIVLERQGRPVAALVSLEDLELLEEIEDEYLDRLADAAEAEGGESIPWEQVRAESEALP
ncbi:MAG: type II toxin-antitoxin system Phd/YefM family antitoxin [Armatimonadetes bacterium]|nr:type II toxin-antitoxin system Phd/YefM family antitoxin [Armatimonadota bacterium]